MKGRHSAFRSGFVSKRGGGYVPYNSEGFLGWAPATPSFLVTGALSSCLLVPLSALSLCRWQVCRRQFFTWRTFFLMTC